MDAGPSGALWEVRDCAHYVGLSENKVRRLADEGKIPHFWLDEEARFGLRFVPALIREWAVKRSKANGGKA